MTWGDEKRSSPDRSRTLFGLPQMPAMMGGVRAKARPEAVAHPAVEDRPNLHSIDGEPIGLSYRVSHLGLTLEEGRQCQLWRNRERAKARGSRKADLGRWLEEPAEGAAPQVQLERLVALSSGGATTCDRFTPHRDVRVGGDGEVTQTLGDRPLVGVWTRGKIVPDRLRNRARPVGDGLKLGANAGKLAHLSGKTAGARLLREGVARPPRAETARACQSAVSSVYPYSCARLTATTPAATM